MIPDAVKRFIDALASLPSIGPRQATRTAFYLIRRGTGAIADLSRAVADLASLRTCSRCFLPYEALGKFAPRSAAAGANENRCSICADTKRNHAIVAVVERETDLISLERSKRFSGRYLILGEIARDGVLEPEQKLRLQHLIHTLKRECGQAEEIILALNPGILGDLESSVIAQRLKPITKKITRLGRGLPTGGEIEFADEDTLAGALENRR